MVIVFFGCSPKNDRNFEIIPNNPITFSTDTHTSPVKTVDTRLDATQESNKVELAAKQERINTETNRLEEERKAKEHHAEEIVFNRFELREQEAKKQLELVAKKELLNIPKDETAAQKILEEERKAAMEKELLEKKAALEENSRAEEQRIKAEQKIAEEMRLKQAEEERIAKEKADKDKLEKDKKEAEELKAKKDKEAQELAKLNKKKRAEFLKKKKAQEAEAAKKASETAQAEELKKKAAANFREDQWDTIRSDFLDDCAPENSHSEEAPVRIRVRTFSPKLKFSILDAKGKIDNFISETVKTYTNAFFVGNGPIYDPNGIHKGYLKSEGVEINKLDCNNSFEIKDRNDQPNYNLANGVFVKFHPLTTTSSTTNPQTIDKNIWKYGVFLTKHLCDVIQPEGYDQIIGNNENLKDQALKDRMFELRRNQVDVNDFPIQNLDQIDFAAQSGPTMILKNAINPAIEKYNLTSNYRSLIGVNSDGNPLVVEVEGNIGHKCLANYLLTNRTYQIESLLHLDSEITDAYFKEQDGSFSGFHLPKTPSPKAASAIVITEEAATN